MFNLDRPRHIKNGRLQAEQTPVCHVIERRPQAAVVIVFERDEAERLQYARRSLAHRAEKLRHPVNRPGLRLKCELDKLPLREGTRQLQKSASNRDGLKFSFCVPAIL